MTDSRSYLWHRRPGLFLATRYLKAHAVSVRDTPLSELPKLSKRTIRLALWLFPKFLDRADLTFPIIVAGRGWYQIALDGRHRISKAIWTGTSHLPTVRVPWGYCLELIVPGFYEGEWLFLFLRSELRKAGHRLHPAVPAASSSGPGGGPSPATDPLPPSETSYGAVR